VLRALDRAAVGFLPGSDRSLDRTRPDDCQQCLLDGIVDAQPAKGNAARANSACALT
jgi:hypothetical protein